MLESIEDFMVTGSFESICSPCPKNWPFVVRMQSPGFDQITLLFLQLLKLPRVLDSWGGWFPSCSGSASISTWAFVGHNSQMHSVCGGRKENGPADLRTYFSRHQALATFYWAKHSDIERSCEDGPRMEAGFPFLCPRFLMTFLCLSRECKYFLSVYVYLSQGYSYLGRKRLKIGNRGNKKHAQR